MPAAIPAIASVAATYAVGGATATVFAGTTFAMTGATFGALTGVAASVATPNVGKPEAPSAS